MNNIVNCPPNIDKYEVVPSLIVPAVSSLHVIKPVTYSSQDLEITLMDKKNTHSLLDIMAIQTGRTNKPTLNELSDNELSFILQLYSIFLRFVNDNTVINKYQLNGSLPRISFSCDPHTEDREGLQPVKRFHTHMYLMTNDTIKEAESNKIKYQDIKSEYLRRRLVDPISFLGNNLIFDIHENFITVPTEIKINKPDHISTINNNLQLGFNAKINNNNDFIGSPVFQKYLKDLHSSLQNVYTDIAYAFTGVRESAVCGKRHALLDKTEILKRLNQLNYLSRSSRQGLEQLVSTLKRPPIFLMKRIFTHDRRVIHHIPTNGLCYAFSIAQESVVYEGEDSKDNLVMNILPKMFSDIGGAGLVGLEGTGCVLLNRGHGSYNEEQMLERWKYQEEFLSYVDRNIGSSFDKQTMDLSSISSIFKNWDKSLKDKPYTIVNR